MARFSAAVRGPFGVFVLGVSAGAALAFGTVRQVDAASAASALVSHRAVYDMKLVQAEGQSGIAGLTGRMVYEFSGDKCDGYSVNFRFVTRFQDVNGGLQVTDLQTTSFEDGNSENYQFLSKTFIDQELVESSRGAARQNPDAKTIDLTEPSEKSIEIGREVQFPTEHMLSILETAASGGRFMAHDIYDGAETGDKVYATTTVIGDRALAGEQDQNATPGAELADVPYWPVTVAYFDTETDDASGELLPVYQLSFRLFENGISDQLVLDYGDFELEGSLTSLEMYDPSTCAE